MAERQHQVEMADIAHNIISGVRESNRIALDCTPGGRAISTIDNRIDPDTAALLDAFAARHPKAARAVTRSQLYEVLTAAGVDLRKVAC